MRAILGGSNTGRHALVSAQLGGRIKSVACVLALIVSVPIAAADGSAPQSSVWRDNFTTRVEALAEVQAEQVSRQNRRAAQGQK